MKKIYFSPERDGFFGAYYPNQNQSQKAMIVMLGDDVDDLLVIAAVKWLHPLGCNVMALAPAEKDYGHHSYPIERIENAVDYLKSHGNEKIGICGASTTGMLALAAASYIPAIRLTLAFTPCDFIMQGFLRDGLDGVKERPAENESSLSYRGKQLPFLPYAYHHPEYWQKIQEEAKRRHDFVASRDLFDESEKLHPVQEEEKIKVENIHGRLVLIGAEDDSLWDTCRYIRRMDERLKNKPHKCRYKILTYEHGSHFCFPQSLLTRVLPIGSGLALALAFESLRDFPIESRQTREDLDKKLSYLIYKW
ncbi:MAG: acyl-CoA thioester hydrolase [Oscillospiraceae bacterium]|nr:acyl-CoA thioester hydrolase [Oscillospiraceae bacterium]